MRINRDRARRVLRRIVGMSVAAAAVLHPTPAQAHSVSNTPSSNFHGHVTSIKPAAKTFRFAVIEATSRAELRWTVGPEISGPGSDR